MTILHVYSDTGVEIQVVSLSAGKVFFRRGRLACAVSRPDLERKGKAYDRVAKQWLYLDKGDALAAVARARQRRLDQEAAEAVARAQQRAAWAYDALPTGAAPQKRATDDVRLRRLKLEMANAHPDRGGTSEAFIAAHKRYLRAKAAREITRGGSREGGLYDR
jgi:hypothetical protein